MAEDADHSNAVIQYFGQKNLISIKFIKERELKKRTGRQSTFQTTFNEVVNGKITGLYSFTTQGAVVYDAYYLRYKDKKKFKLTDRVPDCTDFEQRQ